MRFLRLTSAYPGYVAAFYAQNPGLAERTYDEQKACFDHDHFAWGDSLSTALAGLGYDVLDIDVGLEHMLNAWARENMPADHESDATKIVVERVRRFHPDVLLFDSPDHSLLKTILAFVPEIRLTFGWTGSAIGLADLWRDLDVVLSCAPESVEEMRRRGHRAEHLNHAFDSSVVNRLQEGGGEIPVSFIGSIIRRDSFHMERERILLKVSDRLPLRIFSPVPSSGMRDYAKVAVCGGLHMFNKALVFANLLEKAKLWSPALNRALALASVPRLPINRKLARLAQPGVFGLAYYQAMKSSDVSLNIHADSSPRYASNIRLFEAPGVGSCLLTDWRPNLAELFEPDRELVTYRSADECVEKAHWLLEHPKERQEIARRGQARVLQDHNFKRRAIELDAVIRRSI